MIHASHTVVTAQPTRPPPAGFHTAYEKLLADLLGWRKAAAQKHSVITPQPRPRQAPPPQKAQKHANVKLSSRRQKHAFEGFPISSICVDIYPSIKKKCDILVAVSLSCFGYQPKQTTWKGIPFPFTSDKTCFRIWAFPARAQAEVG